MAFQNLSWVSDPVNCGIIPGWADIKCSTDFVAPGMLSNGFLVGPHGRLPLVLHGFLWDLPNSKLEGCGKWRYIPFLFNNFWIKLGSCIFDCLGIFWGANCILFYINQLLKLFVNPFIVFLIFYQGVHFFLQFIIWSGQSCLGLNFQR